MELFRIFSLEVLLLAIINANEVNSASCDYPAIFNFGDSNSDTGGISAAFYPPASPSGQTYFHRPAGRASDGRLIIDLIAGHLGLPYLHPYLDSIGSIGSSYRHGTNFATGGATILRPDESWFQNGVSPFSLEIQVEHYTQLKDRTAYFYKAKKKSYMKKLPRPEDLSKALFLLDIGQNDVAAAIRKRSSAVPPEIVSHFIAQLKILYEREARIFWIHNTGPIGCLPVAAVKVEKPVPTGYLDEHGCVKSQNDVAIELNKQLKNEIVKLRSELSSEANIIYVDMYTAKLELITTAYKQGFDDPFRICCGYHGVGYDVWCGNRGNVNKTEVFAGSCDNPSRVISWDGVHYSEAANRWIANRIMNGSFSDPPISISRACQMA